MAHRWMWLLAGVFVGAVVAFAWWPEVAQPEGCPEDGCRVGYRFEDGGKAPEGWEPYVTDDPVVALMDACLTYFMTGGLEGTEAAVIFERRNLLLVGVPDTEQVLRIQNVGQDGYATFHCGVQYRHLTSAMTFIENWMTARFSEIDGWIEVSDQTRSFPLGNWRQTAANAELGAIVRFASVPDLVADDDNRESRFEFSLRFNYRGPTVDVERLGQIPDIVF